MVDKLRYKLDLQTFAGGIGYVTIYFDEHILKITSSDGQTITSSRGNISTGTLYTDSVFQVELEDGYIIDNAVNIHEADNYNSIFEIGENSFKCLNLNSDFTSVW